jgi:hydroxyacylglutathione hydrolase
MAAGAIVNRMLTTTGVIHEILPVGLLQCNCHIVGDPHTHEALVIDPGDDAGRILSIIERHKLTVRGIVLTHSHIDHVGGLWRIRQATGAPVQMHADDVDLYRMLAVQAAWIGMKTPESAEIDELLHEGDKLHWGPFEAQVLHTPGHTRGSICLYMPSDLPRARAAAVAAKSTERRPGRLFAGDTLFAGSIGRTDLWGGSFETIMHSLTGKVLELPDDTQVFPGHGEPTTIGQEREANPFLVGN